MIIPQDQGRLLSILSLLCVILTCAIGSPIYLAHPSRRKNQPGDGGCLS